MPKRLQRYNGTNFYGFSPPAHLETLTVECRHGQRAGQPYSYLVLQDHRSIKWKIVPTIGPRQLVHALHLYHRNAYGRRGFHSQRTSWGTPRGVRELINSIRQHELYEQDRTSINPSQETIDDTRAQENKGRKKTDTASAWE